MSAAQLGQTLAAMRGGAGLTREDLAAVSSGLLTVEELEAIETGGAALEPETEQWWAVTFALARAIGRAQDEVRRIRFALDIRDAQVVPLIRR